jgi:hypothetical protein
LQHQLYSHLTFFYRLYRHHKLLDTQSCNNSLIINNFYNEFKSPYTLAMSIQSASAIPPEYGEAANEMLNQAAQNGAAAGGVPAVPPIGEIQGQVPLAQVNPQCVIPAMPIEQQRLIAAQQAGQLGPILGNPTGGPNIGPGAVNQSDPPSFYIPGKPRSVVPRAVNTVAFTTALGVICLNAAWGEPVAILMCSSGLMGLAYKLGKEVVGFMAKNIK